MHDELVTDPFIQSGAPDARGDMRDSMFLHASMQLPPDDAPVPLRIRNLSAGGMKADCAAVLHQGQEVIVGLRNVGVVPGRIVWVGDQQIGVAFRHRIDPRVARKPVGTHAADAALVRRTSYTERRPGLKVK